MGKVRNNYRKTEFLCPECMSTLKTNEYFVKECSGDRIKEWEKAFKKYRKMNISERTLYLETISNKDKFTDLYNKWEIHGHMNCAYSNRIYDIIPNNSVLIVDPLQIKRIEKDIGIKIDLNKLDEESYFWYDGKTYFIEEGPGRHKIKVEWVQLPYDG